MAKKPKAPPPKKAAKPAARQDPTREALTDFCHALLNANEFFYLH